MTFRLAGLTITKMQRTRNTTVCWTKKSQHHIALAWSFKKLLQAWGSFSPGRLLTTYPRTVEQAWRMPNFTSNSRARVERQEQRVFRKHLRLEKFLFLRHQTQHVIGRAATCSTSSPRKESLCGSRTQSAAGNYSGSTSSTASSNTAMDSLNASSGMVRGGAILMHSPAPPTGANMRRPF